MITRPLDGNSGKKFNGLTGMNTRQEKLQLNTNIIGLDANHLTKTQRGVWFIGVNIHVNDLSGLTKFCFYCLSSIVVKEIGKH